MIEHNHSVSFCPACIGMQAAFDRKRIPMRQPVEFSVIA